MPNTLLDPGTGILIVLGDSQLLLIVGQGLMIPVGNPRTRTQHRGTRTRTRPHLEQPLPVDLFRPNLSKCDTRKQISHRKAEYIKSVVVKDRFGDAVCPIEYEYDLPDEQEISVPAPLWISQPRLTLPLCTKGEYTPAINRVASVQGGKR